MQQGILRFQDNLTKTSDNSVSRQTESSDFKKNLSKTLDDSISRQTDFSYSKCKTDKTDNSI